MRAAFVYKPLGKKASEMKNSVVRIEPAMAYGRDRAGSALLTKRVPYRIKKESSKKQNARRTSGVWIRRCKPYATDDKKKTVRMFRRRERYSMENG